MTTSATVARPSVSFPFGKFLQPAGGIEPGETSDVSLPTFLKRLERAGRGNERIVCILRESAAPGRACTSYHPVYALPTDVRTAIVADPGAATIETPTTDAAGRRDGTYTVAPVQYFIVRPDTVARARTVAERERDKTPTPCPVYVPIRSDGLRLTTAGTVITYTTGAGSNGRKRTGAKSVAPIDFDTLLAVLPTDEPDAPTAKPAGEPVAAPTAKPVPVARPKR